MMVKITNGTKTIHVSGSAYDTIYKFMGFKPVDEVEEESKATAAAEVETAEEQKPEGDPVMDALAEKPISEWKQQEIKDFAKHHSIDVSKAKNIDEARAIVKEYLADNA